MHNSEARRRKERQKEQIKQRYNVVIDPENYEYIPAKKQADYYDNDVNQRVAIYVRVSTDDVRQTTSYFLYVPLRLLCPADCRYPYQSGTQHIFREIMLVIQRHRIDPSQRAALRGRSYKKNRHRKLSNAPDAEKSRRETTKPLL